VRGFATSAAIHAPATVVWALLTHAAGYPRWNSTIEKIEGRIAIGERVTLHTRPSAGRAFKLRVSAFEPPARMVWTGGMPLGLFTGTRTFMLAPSADGGTTFTMQEEFAGLLAGLITRSIPDLQPMFDRFAANLKQAAEQPG
jgi:hypothetical protein